MTTRQGGVSLNGWHSLNLGRSVGDDPAAVAENRRRVAEAIGATPVFLKQMHGTRVVRLAPSLAVPGLEPEPADASISLDPALACAVMAADCMPVLFAAPGGVGAAHAGWRGLSAGVLDNTVQALCEATGCEPAQVQAWMGPCIGPAAFEVGADVLEAFGAAAVQEDQPHFRYQANAAGQPRWRADLVGLARQRLQSLGLTDIHGGHWCTFSDPERFFSYRFEQTRHQPGGRMAAVIRLT